MKKLLSFLTTSIAIMVLCTSIASAQEKEKIVTGTITFLSPSNVKVLDEYISSQLYSGEEVFSGLNVKLSSMYRKYENLSWDIYYTKFSRPQWIEETKVLPSLKNPANSQNLSYSSFDFGYGTYYHWKFGKKFMLKAGGMLDVYAGEKTSTPDGVNNFMNMEAHIMTKAHCAIKYGWDFKKWAFDIRALVTVPLFGIISADHPSEPAVSIILGKDYSVLNPALNHVFFASYHNYMSLDYEIGLDFVFRKFTFTAGFGSTSKWWNVYDIQNIRKINYSTLGVAFDIVSRNKFKSSNMNF